MRLSTLLLLALGLVLFAAGCGSSNKAKLEGTKWAANSTTLDGKAQEAGFLDIEFDNDGNVVFRQLDDIQVGQKTRTRSEYRGSYKVTGDKVKLEFTNPWRQKQDWEFKFVIDADKGKLTLTDADNTSLVFYQMKERPPEYTPPPIPKPVTQATFRGPKP